MGVIVVCFALIFISSVFMTAAQAQWLDDNEHFL